LTVFSLPKQPLVRGVFTARLIQHALTTGRAGEQNSLGEDWPSELRRLSLGMRRRFDLLCEQGQPLAHCCGR